MLFYIYIPHFQSTIQNTSESAKDHIVSLCQTQIHGLIHIGIGQFDHA